MREKITGWTSLLGSIFFGLFFIYLVIDEFDTRWVFFHSGMAIFCCSTALYVIWTNFGEYVDSEVKRVEVENELLTKKIKQKELRKKLEED